VKSNELVFFKLLWPWFWPGKLGDTTLDCGDFRNFDKKHYIWLVTLILNHSQELFAMELFYFISCYLAMSCNDDISDVMSLMYRDKHLKQPVNSYERTKSTTNIGICMEELKNITKILNLGRMSPARPEFEPHCPRMQVTDVTTWTTASSFPLKISWDPRGLNSAFVTSEFITLVPFRDWHSLLLTLET